MRMSIYTVVLLVFTINANAWWRDTHSAFTVIALQGITQKTQHEVNLLLSHPITGFGSKEPINQSIDLINGSWADAIKQVKWQHPDARLFYKSMHFINVPGHLGDTLDVSQSRQRILIFLTQNEKKKMNIIDGIQSLIKTIQSADESMRNKAIALRLLVSLLGDIHQPMHLLDVYINNKSTNGQNLIHIEPTISLVGYAGTSEKITVLHLLWDASGGFVKINNNVTISPGSAYLL